MFENYARVSALGSLIAAQAKKPSLYFIGAMKAEGTDTRERFDSVWELIVEPTAKALGMNAKNALAVGSVQIMPGILQDLLSSHVVVADITGENTSVGYEIGIAHSRAKCVILMKQEGYKCGFDLKDINHVCYSLDSAGTRSAKKDLEEHIRHAERSKWMSMDNPAMYALAPATASLTPEISLMPTNALSLFSSVFPNQELMSLTDIAKPSAYYKSYKKD
jgi:hypothetical protein